MFRHWGWWNNRKWLRWWSDWTRRCSKSRFVPWRETKTASPTPTRINTSATSQKYHSMPILPVRFIFTDKTPRGCKNADEVIKVVDIISVFRQGYCQFGQKCHFMHDRPGLQIINPVKEPEPDKGSYELFPSDNKSRRPPPDHSKYLFLVENEPLTRDPRTT